MSLHGLICTFRILYVPLGSRMSIICPFIVSHIPLYDPLWSYMPLRGLICPFRICYAPLWSYTSLKDLICPFRIWYVRYVPFKILYAFLGSNMLIICPFTILYLYALLESDMPLILYDLVRIWYEESTYEAY